MLYGCFSPNLDMYDTFSSRQKKQGVRSKATLKNVKSLKSLIGDPKDFIHHDHFGLVDGQKLISGASNCIDTTNSYPSSPSSSCAAVDAPMSSTSSVNSPMSSVNSPTHNLNSPLADRSFYSSPTEELSVYSPYKDLQPIAEDSAGGPKTNRITRKSVPPYSLYIEPEETQGTEHEEMRTALIPANGSDFGSRGPLDGKGRRFKRNATRSANHSTQFTWDQQRSEASSPSKKEAHQFESISGAESS